MYCLKCGKQIADDSVFCKFCGNKTSPMQRPKAKPEVSVPPLVIKEGICPVCGCALSKEDSNCQVCGFPVISLLHGTDEEIREVIKIAEEYRTQYFASVQKNEEEAKREREEELRRAKEKLKDSEYSSGPKAKLPDEELDRKKEKLKTTEYSSGPYTKKPKNEPKIKPKEQPKINVEELFNDLFPSSAGVNDAKSAAGNTKLYIPTWKGICCPNCGNGDLSVVGESRSAAKKWAAKGSPANGSTVNNGNGNETRPMVFKCTKCKLKFESEPLAAQPQDVLPVPCTVRITNSSPARTAKTQTFYLNGINCGKAVDGVLTVVTDNRHNSLAVTDKNGVAYPSFIRFEAQPGRNISISFPWNKNGK